MSQEANGDQEGRTDSVSSFPPFLLQPRGLVPCSGQNHSSTQLKDHSPRGSSNLFFPGCPPSRFFGFASRGTIALVAGFLYAILPSSLQTSCHFLLKQTCPFPFSAPAYTLLTTLNASPAIQRRNTLFPSNCLEILL